ncbi:hypothetical protein ACFL1N_15325 [Thermodesulfobacteriota bacterium]
MNQSRLWIKPLKVFYLLVIMIITGSLSAYGTESLNDAIKNGKAIGELKIWYQTNDRETGNHGFLDKENSIFDAGLNLGYTTEKYKDFNVGINFYAINDLSAFDTIADNSIHGVDHSETTSWLGEAFLAYNRNNTTIKIGRQNIKSPLINSDGWAVFPNSFEAIWFQNKSISDTSIVSSYVTRERTLKSHTFEDFVDDGGFMLGVENKSIKDIVLSGYYYHIKGSSDINSLYLQVTTKLNQINISTQYMLFDSDAANSNSTNAYGFLASSKIGKFNLSGAVSTVDKGTLNAAKFSDNGIKTPLFTASMCADGDIASATDTDSLKLTAGFSPLDKLSITGVYGYYDHGSSSSASPNNESTSKEIIVKYTGFKNSTIFAAYVNSDHNGTGAWKGCTAGDALNSFRIWISYKF